MLELIINYSRVSPLVASIANLLLGAMVLIHNRNSKKNIVFSLFIFSWSIWTFGDFFYLINFLFLNANYCIINFRKQALCKNFRY